MKNVKQTRPQESTWAEGGRLMYGRSSGSESRMSDERCTARTVRGTVGVWKEALRHDMKGRRDSGKLNRNRSPHVLSCGR